uniref:Syntaxin binding protein 4 n=1 Tax=Hippocampus comes TaxID=109280 RepID=A0A3Q2Z6I2_HIPCM
ITDTSGEGVQPLLFDSVIQLICIAKGSGLGLVIKGGTNRAEGPMVFIQDMVAGGDCQKDGRLQVGDQLVSINKESLIGVTYEEARTILTRTKLRSDLSTFIVQNSKSSKCSSENGSLYLHVDCPRLILLRGEGVLTMRAYRSAFMDVCACVQALDLLGLNPSDAQRQALWSRLRTHPPGVVAYAAPNLFLRAFGKATASCRLASLTSSHRQEAKAAAEETQTLRARAELAEEARKQARGMEMDYEEVVHLLEAEIAELKTQRAKDKCIIPMEDVEQLKKAAAVLQCQLRKSDAAKKTLETATAKLLTFVAVRKSAMELASWTAAALAKEAHHLRTSVGNFLDVDTLPYGWEEAYTEHGVKYFIEQTQTSSSPHPAVNLEAFFSPLRTSGS